MDVIVGTAGHIDHGKTALVKALTGTDADRLPEEKRRGITVDLGFAELTVGDIRFGFIDVPGHERFVRNMLAGASGIDIALLVIAADDGVMPQTREHFDICRLLGVSFGVVAITKSDLADADTIELARFDAAELVAGSFLDGAPMVNVSSRTGEGIEELKIALKNAAAKRSPSPLIARLPIDRSFSMKGFGTVVTGTLASGTISEGDEMDLLPTGRRVRVRGLQSYGASVSSVSAGQRVAVNLSGVERSEVTRGMMLSAAGVLQPTQIIDARLEVLADAIRPIRSRQRVRLHCGTAEVLARVKVLDGSGEIAPSDDAIVQLTLETPITVVPGERFIIRKYSPPSTIGGGIAIDNSPPRHRMRDFGTVVAGLRRLAAAEGMAERLALIIDASGKRGLTIGDLQARTGWQGQAVIEALEQSIVSGVVVDASGVLVAASVLTELISAAAAAIDAFHRNRSLARGLAREELRETVFHGAPDNVFQTAIEQLTAAGTVIAQGDLLRSASFRTELSAKEQSATDAILSALVAARLEVPRISEVLATVASSTRTSPAEASHLLRLLVEDGAVVKVTDDLYFGGGALAELTERIRRSAETSQDRSIDVARFKELAKVSRKYAIPLLEYFDREKVTVRRGDSRVIL